MDRCEQAKIERLPKSDYFDIAKKMQRSVGTVLNVRTNFKGTCRKIKRDLKQSFLRLPKRPTIRYESKVKLLRTRSKNTRTYEKRETFDYVKENQTTVCLKIQEHRGNWSQLIVRVTRYSYAIWSILSVAIRTYISLNGCSWGNYKLHSCFRSRALVHIPGKSRRSTST